MRSNILLISTFCVLFTVLAGCGADPPPAAVMPAVAESAPAAPPVTGSPASQDTKPAATHASAKHFEIVEGALKLPAPVAFETSSANLAPAGHETLSVVVDYLTAKPDITLLRIEAHTDNDGPPAASAALSEQRAMSVARWLVEHGVDCKRIIPVGFGGTKPIAANDTPENKAKNRRVMFVNAALRGRLIGGMPPEGGGRTAGDPCSPRS